MARLIILGIDSMDSALLARFEPDMPNFRRLRQRGPGLSLKSVYPPDSATCWATIYTGLNPARHGVITFVDPLEKVSKFVNADIDTSPFRGRCFWDVAGQAGKRVCVLFPHLGYPVWPVNGVMVGRTNLWDIRRYPISTFPEEIAGRDRLAPLNTLKGYPSQKKFLEYVRAAESLIKAETDFGLRMYREEKWDLFFIYSSTLDWVQHNLWRYYDETDPTYPGPTPLKDEIPRFYRLYDEFLGRFLDAAGPDTAVMVLSDHGHGMRPVKIVNINEILRQKGFLVPRIKNASYSDPIYAVEKAKKKAAALVNRFGIGTIALKTMQLFPQWRKLYTAPLSVDWEKTTAHVTDMSGIKAYTYGGVTVRRENIRNGEYESVREAVIKELSTIPDPCTGDNLVRWIRRREDIYTGEHIGKYPDLVFDLKYGYGAGWEIFGQIVTECRTHNIQPGSHKGEYPVLFLSAPGAATPAFSDVTLMDIAPTALGILGVKCHDGLNGRDIMKSPET